MLRLLFDRTLVVDRILVRETDLQFERTEADGVLMQGVSLKDLAALVPESNEASDVVVIGQDIAVSYREPARIGLFRSISLCSKRRVTAGS